MTKEEAPSEREGTVRCSFGPVWYQVVHGWEERPRPDADQLVNSVGRINIHAGGQINEAMVAVLRDRADPVHKPRINVLRHMLGMLDRQLVELDGVLEEYRKPAERRMRTVLTLTCSEKSYDASVVRHHRDRSSSVTARKAALNKLLYHPPDPAIDFQHRNRVRNPEIAPELRDDRDIEAIWRAICPELFGTEAAQRRQLRRIRIHDEREDTRLVYRALARDPDRLMRLVHSVIDRLLVDAATVVAENHLAGKRAR